MAVLPMTAPLDSIIVLDFSHALAGPYCTMLMAQQGASVYKLEHPGGGDMGRGWGPPFQGGESWYFLSLNSGKKSVCIDLKSAEGRNLILRLIDRADVLIENFRPGAMARAGLSYESVRPRNPRLIYCSISGYGQDGPGRDQPAMDLIVQASGGLMSVTGTEDGEMVRCGQSVADISAGMTAAFSIMTALFQRERTGEGQYIDVAMLDSLISAMASNWANYLGLGKPPRPLGTSFYSIVPYRTFPTADQQIAVAVGSEKMWLPFCKAIGREDLADHPEFLDNHLRTLNRAVLEPVLMEIFRTAGSEHWLRKLEEQGVPCAPVRTLPQVAADPQVTHRHMLIPVDHPAAGRVTVTGTAAKLANSPNDWATPAPRLGEHTRETLADLLKMSSEEIDRLGAQGVILDGPALNVD